MTPKYTFHPIEKQKYWSCTKDLRSVEEVKKFTCYYKFKYFIVFKFDVTYDDVLFDMNKMYNCFI